MRDQRMMNDKKGFFALSLLKSWLNKLLIDLNPPLEMQRIPVWTKVDRK